MKRRDMAHPMSYECLPYEIERQATGRRLPHAHPMPDDLPDFGTQDIPPPPPWAFWSVAIAGGIVGALVLWSAVVVLIAVLGGPADVQ